MVGSTTHAAAIASTGIYNFCVRNEQVPLPTEIKHSQLECVERLNAEGQRPLSPCLLDNAHAAGNEPYGSAVSRAWG
jgi:hypothetical protein